MTAIPLHEIIPVLQVASGPVILISGVGLLMLTMTNRRGCAIDRARALVDELREGRDRSRGATLAQVTIIYRRARLIRMSIALVSLSVLPAAVLIIVLFLTALMGWDHGFSHQSGFRGMYGVVHCVAVGVHLQHSPGLGSAEVGIEAGEIGFGLNSPRA